MTIKNIYDLPVEDVALWLTNDMYVQIPLTIDTEEELKYASTLMASISNNYAYLSNIYASLKFLGRQAKDRKDKAKSDEIIDKRELIHSCLESLSKQRDTISRMITIKQIVNEELKTLHLL